jgi:hypothetical protein
MRRGPVCGRPQHDGQVLQFALRLAVRRGGKRLGRRLSNPVRLLTARRRAHRRKVARRDSKSLRPCGVGVGRTARRYRVAPVWAHSRRRGGACECERRLLCRPCAGGSLGTAAASESPPSMDLVPCVATVLACSSGAVRVTGPPTLCGCSRQDVGPTDGWPGANRRRSGPLRCQCRPKGAAPLRCPCMGALAAPL